MSKHRVLVTGSSRGIGRAIALRLASDGFEVCLHCLNSLEASREVAQEIARNCAVEAPDILKFDVGDRAQTRDVLEKYLDEKGAFYGVVCNAGVTRDGPFPGFSDDDWDTVLRTSLDGFYNVVQPLVMPMIRQKAGGRVVIMSSLAGQIGNRGQVNYSAAKAGLIGASKALAKELGKRKITVNCVAPGFVSTEMTAELVSDELLSAIPLRRFAEPQEVAGMVSYLFRQEAGYVTGQVFSINGGLA